MRWADQDARLVTGAAERAEEGDGSGVSSGTLATLARRLAGTRTSVDSLRAVAEVAQQVSGASAAVTLQRADGGWMGLAAAGLDEEARRELTRLAGASAGSWDPVLAAEGIVYATVGDGDGRHNASPRDRTGNGDGTRRARASSPLLADPLVARFTATTGSQTVAALPLVHGGEAVGALLLGWPKADGPPLTRRAEVLVEAVGSQGATALRAAQTFEEAESRRHRDRLTGVGDRSVLVSALAGELEEASDTVGTDVVAALLVLDLDDFQTVNDSLGHEVGDRVLREVARRLDGEVRDGDVVTRTGGDEFGVLIRGIGNGDAALAAAHRLLGELARPIELPHGRVRLTGTMGVALVRGGGPGTAELLRQADMALYEGKQRGSGATLYEPSIGARVTRRAALRRDLAGAIHDGSVRAVYQPVVDVAARRAWGVEVLARWHHPDHGDVPPAEFVAIAEELGIVADLDAAVREQALAAIGGAGDGMRLAMNATGSELRGPDELARLRELLARSGVPPVRVMVELSERVAVADLDAVAAAVARLRETDVMVAIDDFGVGDAGLAALARLRPDVVKIDGSLVRGADDDADARLLLEAVVTLSRSLGAEIIAEGAETLEQLQRVRRLGVRLVQGFLVGRPTSHLTVAASVAELPSTVAT